MKFFRPLSQLSAVGLVLGLAYTALPAFSDEPIETEETEVEVEDTRSPAPAPSINPPLSLRLQSPYPARTFSFHTMAMPWVYHLNGDREVALLYGAALRLQRNWRSSDDPRAPTNPTGEFFTASFSKAYGDRLYNFNAEGAAELYEIHSEPVVAGPDEEGRPSIVYALRVMVRGEGRHNLLRLTIDGVGDLALRNTFFGVTPEAVASMTRINGNRVVSASIQMGPTVGMGRYALQDNHVQQGTGGQVAFQGFLKVTLNHGFAVSMGVRDQIRFNFNPEFPIDGPFNEVTAFFKVSHHLRNSPNLDIYGMVGGDWQFRLDANSDLFSANESVGGIFFATGVEFHGVERGVRRQVRSLNIR